MRKSYKLGRALRRSGKLQMRFLLVLGVFGVAITAASFNFGDNRAGATVPGTNSLVSVNTTGTPGAGQSNGSRISANGQYVVFSSIAQYLVPTDANTYSDMFVRDLSTNTTSRVSVSSSGVVGNASSSNGVISETGRYVVFRSGATNLIDGVTLPVSQMYMRDRVGSTTILLSEISSGVYPNAHLNPLSVSSDGRFVLISSEATNLGPTITNSSRANIFVLDRQSNTYTLVSVSGGGTLANDSTTDAQMSCDGSFVVFRASGGTKYDIFLLDRRKGDVVTNVSATANAAALSPKISCNGRYIGFASLANNLDNSLSFSQGEYHGYVYDRYDGGYKLVDQSTAGILADRGIINYYATPLDMNISDKGVVVFKSNATTLTSYSGSEMQLFVRDIRSNTTELLTRDAGGTAGNMDSMSGTVDLEGKVVAYVTSATNLLSISDTNAAYDVLTSLTGY